jgi:Tol biopolymer transport system component
MTGQTHKISTIRAIRAPLLIFSCLFAVSAAIILIGWLINLRSREHIAFAAPKLTNVTSSGNAVSAAISPEGKYLAYIVKETSGFSVRLRQLNNGSDRQIRAAASVSEIYLDLGFSPDGEDLYFLKKDGDGPGSLYRIPNLSGAALKLAEGVEHMPGISPDGKTLAFIRSVPDRNEAGLFLMSADGGDPQKLAVFPADVGFVASVRPAWTLDGEHLLCAVKKTGGENYAAPVLVDIVSGKIAEFSSLHFLNIVQIALMPDMRSIVVAGVTRETGERSQLWFVDTVQNKTRRITSDQNDYREIGITGDGKTVAAVIGHDGIASGGNPTAGAGAENLSDVVLISDNSN